MTGTERAEGRACDICGTSMAHIRRITRSTYVCPHSADRSHVDARRARRERAAIERIERLLADQER